MANKYTSVATLTFIAGCLAGCTVTVPSGEPIYAPPAVVEEAPAYRWRWFWPHQEVEHHYVVENDRVVVHENRYYPGYDRSHPYVRQDEGNHRGWYKKQHRDDDHHDHD